MSRIHPLLRLVGTYPFLPHRIHRVLTSYYFRLDKHRDEISRLFPEHNRWGSTSQACTFLAGLQPGIAWFGLVASLAIVFVFTSATWWSTPVDFSKVAVAYGSVSHAYDSIARITH